MKIKINDYVLATKYSDGDPCDHFCVGVVKRIMEEYSPERYDIADALGKSFRGNGFRKVKKITQGEGEELAKIFPEISDQPGRSLWWHLAEIKKNPRSGER
jgi:hypothetical protein